MFQPNADPEGPENEVGSQQEQDVDKKVSPQLMVLRDFIMSILSKRVIHLVQKQLIFIYFAFPIGSVYGFGKKRRRRQLSQNLQAI